MIQRPLLMGQLNERHRKNKHNTTIHIWHSIFLYTTDKKEFWMPSVWFPGVSANNNFHLWYDSKWFALFRLYSYINFSLCSFFYLKYTKSRDTIWKNCNNFIQWMGKMSFNSVFFDKNVKIDFLSPLIIEYFYECNYQLYENGFTGPHYFVRVCGI